MALTETVAAARPAGSIQGSMPALVAAGLVLVAFGCLLFAHPDPPSFGDYASWTYHGVLLRDVLQGHPDAGYWLKNYPVPNSMTTVGLALLMLIMPWQAASKLWLLLAAVSGTFSAFRLLRSAGADLSRLMLLFPAMILSGVFWYGFLNFLLGCYVAIVIAALLLRGTVRPWLISSLLVLNFFCHMIPFGFASLLVLLYALQHRRLRWLWTLAPGALLSLWYFAGRLAQHDADGQAGMVASARFGTPLFLLYKANSLLKCWGFINPVADSGHSVLLAALGSEGFLAVFACSVAAAALGCWMLADSARRGLIAGAKDRFFWLSVTVFAGVGLLLPGAAAGISDPGGRMIELAVWSGLCVAASRTNWVRWSLTGCGTVLLAADLLLLTTAAGSPSLTQAAPSHLPVRLQDFNHVYAFDGLNYYQALNQSEMNRTIYPTAMFLKR